MNAKQRRIRRRAWSLLLRIRYGFADERGRYTSKRLTPEEDALAFEIAAAHACIKGNMEEAIFKALAGPPKVPFTREGIDKIEATIRDTLTRAEQEGAFGYDTTEVTIEPAQPGDKEARILRSVTFKMPIYPITIKGTFSV